MGGMGARGNGRGRPPLAEFMNFSKKKFSEDMRKFAGNPRF
jgi:hypothetical protein